MEKLKLFARSKFNGEKYDPDEGGSTVAELLLAPVKAINKPGAPDQMTEAMPHVADSSLENRETKPDDTDASQIKAPSEKPPGQKRKPRRTASETATTALDEAAPGDVRAPAEEASDATIESAIDAMLADSDASGAQSLKDEDPDKFALSYLFFNTSRTKEGVRRLDNLMTRGRKANNEMALPVLGVPGCGKTHLVLQYPRIFQKNHEQKLRMLYVELVTGATPNSLAAQLLAKAGDPNPTSGTEAERTSRLGALIRGRYDVLVLDEIQRLIDRQTEKVLYKAADYITYVLNEATCPVIFCGEPRTTMLFENPHFAGRAYREFMVKPFRWSDSNDRIEFKSILGAYERQLDFPRPSSLSCDDIAMRVFAFSSGLFRPMSNLLEQAAVGAARRKSPCIEMADLTAAAEEVRSVSSDSRNPFMVRDSARLEESIRAAE